MRLLDALNVISLSASTVSSNLAPTWILLLREQADQLTFFVRLALSGFMAYHPKLGVRSDGSEVQYFIGNGKTPPLGTTARDCQHQQMQDLNT